MNLERIQQTLQNRFSEPLPEAVKRRIIFWYDADAGFADLIGQLELPGVKIWRLAGNNYFATKRLLERDDPESNYLVYAPFARPQYEDDWLLDIYLYSQEYRADPASVTMGDLGITNLSLKPLIQKNLTFFKNAERFRKLQALPHTVWDEATLELGMMAVAAKVKTPVLEDILLAVLTAGLTETENEPWRQIDKWPGLDRFWHYVSREYGYYSDQPGLKKLLLSLLLTGLGHDYRGELPGDWRDYLLKNKANGVVFLDHWMTNRELAAAYDQYAHDFEDELQLRQRIRQWPLKTYLECDTFSIFDRAVVLHIVNSLVNGSQEYASFQRLIDCRKTRHWHAKYRSIYEALEAALELFFLVKQYEPGFPVKQAADTFMAYTKEYYRADQAYRHFYLAYDRINDLEILKSLQKLVENAYTNGFLQPLAVVWSELVEQELEVNWPILSRLVQQQSNFYRDYIEPVLRRDKERIYVIISDAFRYEAAAELTARLNRESPGAAELVALQGVLPSFTKLGMSALLPGKTFEITKAGKILRDGKDTDGLAQRQKILRDACAASLAISLPQLVSLSRDDGRELIRSHRVIYIYHDTIDAVGDKYASEHQVFEAVERALAELEKGLRYIGNQLNGANVLITADHGFLYNREPLAESDKIDRERLPAYCANRRFIVAPEAPEIAGILQIKMNYLLDKDSKLAAFTPKAAQRFKVQGGGCSYVHGGAALQEVVVPLIRYKNIRSGKGKEALPKVEVKLASVTRKITNNTFTLEFFQTEKVSETTLPRRLRVMMADAGGHKISDEQRLIANRGADRADERVFKIRLTLKGGRYDRNCNYYLSLLDEELGLEYERIPFTINLGISNDFDDF